MNLSVVVPVYNSEQLLPDLVKRLGPVRAAAAAECELILVDGSSRDRSRDAINEPASGHVWVRDKNLLCDHD